ncbi:2-oxoglutarate dehydrogenase E1 component [Geobacter pelophilus]|uniref:oxoglutarate dehydrogenase (succinyl-transferring) n=1 Tax=Geoanaerobacter pelophilus TaxID=60036 RepID=A0AAW4L643_9BACT|nr:2-oxoglutarate dehydrogenase E1 component [Geoanaerobacter pelophilus]MBT0663504.1 2-oxoglutarate dehydrogenase E1 component [Geoanaerobacter pelophilus]
MSFKDALDPSWLEGQYLLWRRNPESLSPDWRAFFEGFELADQKAGPPGPVPGKASCVGCSAKQSGVQSLIYGYRDIGHLMACTDPLAESCPVTHPQLELSCFGLDPSDLATEFSPWSDSGRSATLQAILDSLRESYCGSIGTEFMHIQEPAERQWLIERLETANNDKRLSTEERIAVLKRLVEASLFESFLHRKFLGQKRFSLEGGESLIVFLDEVVNGAAATRVSEIVFGMAHRGRLNVLAHIMGKPLANIFSEFSDNRELAFVGEGDVKYHKGFSTDRRLTDGRRLHLTLAFNPSHLEVVDPVVEGKTRAIQDTLGSEGKDSALPVLVHGDAAFAGQGIVAETLNMSQLEGYTTGGTIHVVLNNQIGFTTLPKDARSTRYATDIARMLMIPIFHVHGDDPDAVARVGRLALEYRQAFKRDVVVEIICYRRHGHNEGDEPAFTQPLMYQQISQRPLSYKIFASKLDAEGVDFGGVESIERDITGRLEQALTEEPDPTLDLGFTAGWQGIERDYEVQPVATGVPHAVLADLTSRLSTLPPGFAPHPKVAAVYQRRNEAVQSGHGLDWGGAEALAFATLLAEGVAVRLSGQDSRRGTFNHRHAVLHDSNSDETFTPLAGIGVDGARFSVYDSLLSEAGVLGFEYGYSVASPESLVIWEAQFGDFANGGQVVIDQFIAAGESKWDRSSGLVLLLPHGYEGNGAEHSSARVERFLQLCAEENMLVCYPSTPAQLFHLLRRQVKLPFRKPLVVFTPKSMLRHPACVSSLDGLATGGFCEVLPDPVEPSTVSTAILCSGKLYFELVEQRAASGRSDVAIIRIEQLYPFRAGVLLAAVAPLLGVGDWRWVQEEPANMGAWPYIRSLLTAAIGREFRYVGRPASAAPATGSHRMHGIEQKKLLDEAFQKG